MSRKFDDGHRYSSSEELLDDMCGGRDAGAIKDIADGLIKSRHFAAAIDVYGRALLKASVETHTDLRARILSNRSSAYMRKAPPLVENARRALADADDCLALGVDTMRVKGHFR